MAKTMVQECFSKIGDKLDLITKLLKREKSLPPGAVEIEYLGSTGSAYIKTGIIQSDDLVINCSFRRPLGGQYAWQAYFGCGYSDNAAYNILARAQNGQHPILNVWFANNSNSECQISVSQTEMNSIKLEAGNCVVNGTSYSISTVAGKMASYEIYLFGANKDDSLWRSSILDIGSFSITKNGIVILDLIPIRIEQVGYFFDLVSGQLFGNAGTGSFILGPDKS